jgi:alanyl-tRNA synthetase
LQSAVAVGTRRVVVHRESDAALAKALGSVLQNAPGTIALLGAADGTIVCAAARDVSIDLATFASATARELGGSGGGKGGFAQVKLGDGSRVDEMLQRMQTYVAQQLS